LWNVVRALIAKNVVNQATVKQTLRECAFCLICDTIYNV
jgi:hypothetical protein